MPYWDNRLKFKENINLCDGSRISLYQKIYKYADTWDEFDSMKYKGTKEWHMYLHNSDQPYDSNYDFELLLDTWQMNYVKSRLESAPDWTYDKVKGWFKEMCKPLNSLIQTSADFGTRVIFKGKKTTELMKCYHVFNEEK